MATRRSQPYRKGNTRLAGPALMAMRRGRAANTRHPFEQSRLAAKRARKKRRRRRGVLVVRRKRQYSAR